ncbi:hypothetical protein P8C59_008576 [Phyllachora maydis]|uniref:Ankyrin repeat protein n=1 Tax=Phyllachora maydis TaxID=1825666 RepID=A0AAD9ICJ8_9PEZI|nr:hypothetical protein P8C59_008576 [Phyllachora maydis]
MLLPGLISPMMLRVAIPDPTPSRRAVGQADGYDIEPKIASDPTTESISDLVNKLNPARFNVETRAKPTGIIERSKILPGTPQLDYFDILGQMGSRINTLSTSRGDALTDYQKRIVELGKDAATAIYQLRYEDSEKYRLNYLAKRLPFKIETTPFTIEKFGRTFNRSDVHKTALNGPPGALGTLSVEDQKWRTTDPMASETSRPRLHQAVLTGTSAADLEQLVRSGDGHVNQPDPDGLLALHALCAEGCWEEELQAYVFEEEQALWSDYNKPDLYDSQDLMKTTIPDDWILGQYLQQTYGEPLLAKRFRIRSAQDTAGLHDVLPLLLESLLKHGEKAPDLKLRIEQDIRLCEPEESFYNAVTTSCEKFMAHSPTHVWTIKDDVGDIARLLAQHGFASLLETLIHSRYGSQIPDDISGPSTPVDPIMVVACRRELPNMNVVRLLVRQAGVDVNARSRTGEEAFADINRPGEVYADDAVKVVQGIPNLILSGADLGQRSEDGQTPLELAENMPEATFTKEAARAQDFCEHMIALR